MKSEFQTEAEQQPGEWKSPVAKPINEQADYDPLELPERNKTAVNVLILFLAFWVGYGAGGFRAGLFMVALGAVLIKYWEYFRG